MPGETPQAHTLKAVMGFEERKSHLDLLALVARLFVLRRAHEATGMIAGIFMDVACDLARGRVRTALQLQSTTNRGDSSDHAVGRRNSLRKYPKILLNCHRCFTMTHKFACKFGMRFQRTKERHMDRRSILTIGAAAGLGLLPRAVIAQQKTLKEQIVGSWTLVSWVQTRPDGTKNYRFGNSPKGVNMFSPTGRFSIIIV